MKRRLFISLIVLTSIIFVTVNKSCCANENTKVVPTKRLSGCNKQRMQSAKDFFTLIDINSPGLEKVRKYINKSKYSEALDAYRDNFIERSSGIKISTRPSFWLWGYTNPDDLLKNGEVGTSQYGNFHVITRYVVGMPGNVNWHKIPDDGYDTVLRDLATMHWASPLISTYEKTKDIDYLTAWSGYWTDFSDNWLDDHKRIMSDSEYKNRVFGSIVWARKSILYQGWRLQNYFGWLFIAASKSQSDCRSAIDSSQLASVLKYFAEYDIPNAIQTAQKGGVPNQIVICSNGLMQAITAMRDFKDADKWKDSVINIIETHVENGEYLADGSSMEQSYNYNVGLIKSLSSFIEISKYPPFNTNGATWESRLNEKSEYRDRYLSSVLMPDGRMPSIGCGNNFVTSADKQGKDRLYSYEREKAKYKKPLNSSFTLKEKIRNHIFSDSSLPAPNFDSIYYPYGGYVIMRDAWGHYSHYAYMKTSRPAVQGHFREGGNGLAISAFGKYLLVNSSAKAYSKLRTYKPYFHSTLSQNSISVDGYSQLIRKQVNCKEVPSNYVDPIPARWHTSEEFDFAEGLFRGSYGGYNYLTNLPREQKGANPIEDVHVTGVEHDRQLLFLRKYGIWIVTDILRSRDEHLYCLSWNFSPDFNEKDIYINSEDGSVKTQKLKHPNIFLRHFSSENLEYKKYYGIADESATLGWVAIEKSKGAFTPAVDIHVNWNGKNDQLLVTLIEPAENIDSQVETITDISDKIVSGFQLKLKDGQEIVYLASIDERILDAGAVKANARSLLLISDDKKSLRGIVLDCSKWFLNGHKQNVSEEHFEFISNEDGLNIIPIKVPAGFKWIDNENGVLPQYE